MTIGMKDIREVGRRIAREFQPERVILFGSHARHGQRRFRHRRAGCGAVCGSGFRQSLKILNRLNSRLPIDLMAYRPAEVERRYREGDPLIRNALDHGKVLYAKRDG